MLLASYIERSVAEYCWPIYPVKRPLPGSGTCGVIFNLAALAHIASIVPSIAGAVVVLKDTNVVPLVTVAGKITWSFFVQLTQ